MRKAGSLGDRPFTVISAHVEAAPRGLAVERVDRIWMEMQKALTTLSSCHKHIVADKSGHFIHLDRPDVVSAAIHWVVEEVRHRVRSAQPQIDG